MKKGSGFSGGMVVAGLQKPGFEAQKNEVHKSQAFPFRGFQDRQFETFFSGRFFGKFFTIKRK